MEIGPVTQRPVQFEPGPVRAVPPASAGTPVATELPPSRAVGQAGRAGEVDRASDAVGKPPESVERRFDIDDATRELISSVFDGATGELLSQVPDRALLRLKAYAREDAARLDAQFITRRVERTV